MQVRNESASPRASSGSQMSEFYAADGPIELWTLGLGEARRQGWEAEHVFAEGAAWGMAWVFAIQGMFEAIKRTYMCWECNCYIGLKKWDDGGWLYCDCDRVDDHVCTLEGENK